MTIENRPAIVPGVIVEAETTNPPIESVLLKVQMMPDDGRVLLSRLGTSMRDRKKIIVTDQQTILTGGEVGGFRFTLPTQAED